MPKSATKRGKKNKRPIEPYQHTGKQRINNPPTRQPEGRHSS